MADFLASFSLGAEAAAPGGPSPCASVDDMQLSLGNALAGTATPTRAQHVAVTLDVGASATFSLCLSQAENGVLDGLGALDPSLGGLRPSGVAAADNPADNPADGALVRLVSAADALTNQPQDNPVLQRAVAKHVVSALGATDGSAWVMREMSRGPQGWNFTYLCRDSLQQWDRQNRARAVKSVIGEYTLKDPDPILTSRPAFDCRGTVKISFSRSSRSISIKYDHTPLHKTVAEVAELFKPPPRPVVVGGSQKQKSPKKPASARKKKRQSAPADSGNPRKRAKKNGGPAQAQAAAPGHDVQPAAELPQGHGQAPPDGGYPGPSGQAAADVSAADTAQAAEPGPAQPSAAPGASFPINISPDEAARRRQVATKLLMDAGVNPDSLSAEQFSIFANQSPDLQKESLNMLVKYGAERLRIVHPSNRDSSASAPASAAASPAQASQATPSGPMATEELVRQPSGAAAETYNVAKGSKKKYRKLGRSRSTCLQCKSRKVKCSREKPTCSECQTAQLACEYAPPKPKTKRKSDAMVPADDEVEDESHLEQAPQQGQDDQGEAAQAQAQPREEELDEDGQPEQEAEEQGPVPDYSSYPQVPVADMLTPNVDLQHVSRATHSSQPPYFGSASGLALPQPEGPPASQQQMHTISSGQVLPQGTTMHFPSLVAHEADEPLPRLNPSGNGGGDAVQPLASAKQSSMQWSAGSRRSLPTGPSRTQSRKDGRASPQAASAWSSGVDPGGPAAAPPVHQRAAEGHGSGASYQRLPVEPPLRQDAMALSQAALEHHRQAQDTSAAMQAAPDRPRPSHPADGSRAASQQGQRAQASGPGASQPRPAAMADVGSNGRAAAPDPNDAPLYGGYDRYPDAMPANRIGYEPYSYRRGGSGAASLAAHDCGRSSAATTMAPAMAPAPRGHAAPNRTASPYSEPGPTEAHDFSARAAAPPPARPGHGAAAHPQHQQPGPQGGPSHHGLPSWYGFGNGNAGGGDAGGGDAGGSGSHAGSSHLASYAFGNQRRPSYSWKLPDEPWGGVS